MWRLQTEYLAIEITSIIKRSSFKCPQDLPQHPSLTKLDPIQHGNPVYQSRAGSETIICVGPSKTSILASPLTISHGTIDPNQLSMIIQSIGQGPFQGHDLCRAIQNINIDFSSQNVPWDTYFPRGIVMDSRTHPWITPSSHVFRQKTPTFQPIQDQIKPFWSVLVERDICRSQQVMKFGESAFTDKYGYRYQLVLWHERRFGVFAFRFGWAGHLQVKKTDIFVVSGWLYHKASVKMENWVMKSVNDDLEEVGAICGGRCDGR